MPGPVDAVAPVAVFPSSLSRSFQRVQEFPVNRNDFRNGESIRGLIATASRKRWRMSKSLTPSQILTLRNFYLARNGEQQAFYWYDVWETSPKFSYDATGTATVGRYIVRFNGPFEQTANPGRLNVDLELVEIA